MRIVVETLIVCEETVEGIGHNTVKEYSKFYNYTKNLTLAYQQRNLSVWNMNGELLSEKRWWMEYFEGKLCDQRQTNFFIWSGKIWF